MKYFRIENDAVYQESSVYTVFQTFIEFELS